MQRPFALLLAALLVGAGVLGGGLLGAALAAPAEPAAPHCRGSGWQPTIVHDLEYPDGPWYVMRDGDFRKLRLLNGDWVRAACLMIARQGVRSRQGYTGCKAYAKIQCGCTRKHSWSNRTCANFMRRHTRPYIVRQR